MKLGRASLLTIGLGALIGIATPREAKAQGAVAFVPNIAQFNDGAFLSVTPVVSADRRYVRLVNIQPVFNQLDSFEVFTIPAAVAGVGGGGFGGFGGLGGGGGGGIGGGGGGGGGFGGRNMGLGNNRMMGLSGFNESNPLSSFTAFANTPDSRQQVMRPKSAKSKKATAAKKKSK